RRKKKKNAERSTLGTAPQSTSRKGCLEIARLLLKYGADIDVVGRDGRSVLQAASREGRLEVVQLLLEHGAYINAATEGWDGSALQAARRRDSPRPPGSYSSMVQTPAQ
ncbi:hypothetical protein BC834DRAFT_888543, partial [Gloeopeniophorella convolvens]